MPPLGSRRNSVGKKNRPARGAGRFQSSAQDRGRSVYALRRRRISGRAATARRPSDAGSGTTTSLKVRLSKISALKSWLFAAELPASPVSSLPSEIWLPPKVTEEVGTVVIGLPS